MRKTILALAVLALVGAGCAPATEPQGTNETPGTGDYGANPPSGETSNETTPGAAEPAGDLTLTAEAMGNMEVKLAWKTAGAFETSKLNESNRFILVRGDTENPAHDGKHDWIRQNHTIRDVVWKQTKTGPAHFRLCITQNNEKDICTVYSNNVSVDVK